MGSAWEVVPEMLDETAGTETCMLDIRCRSRVAAERMTASKGDGQWAVNIPVSLLDFVLCGSGADVQQLVELCLLDHFVSIVVLPT